jgi:hypothetical protein
LDPCAANRGDGHHVSRLGFRGAREGQWC